MKRIILAIAAITAIAACTKSEVTYEAPGEIGFAPVTGNITKASGKAGALTTDQELGIYAFWDKDLVFPQGQNNVVVGNSYGDYTDNYLVNALFASKTATSWGGSPTGHPWPVNGALVFAGYTTPGDVVLTTGTQNGNVTYDLSSDTMTFTGYNNSSEFDLCWFGRTAYSYNNRKDGTAIGIELSHALSWITIAAYAEKSAIGWTITSMKWKVPTSGTAACTGSGDSAEAVWDPVTYPEESADPTNILSDSHTLKAISDEGKGAILTNNLVIPSFPVNLTIDYTFMVNGVPKTDSKTVSLKLADGNTQKWVSGVHYTYTLKFEANEILVSPSYGNWDEDNDNNVTVE